MHNLERLLEHEDFSAREIPDISLWRKPYDATCEIISEASDVVKECDPDDDFTKARLLNFWFHFNIEYKKGFPYVSASGMFRRRKGVCADISILYTTMAKIVGLESYYVRVTKNETGKSIRHACSGIFFGDKLTLLDPGNGFNPNYKEFMIIDDDIMPEYYNNFLLKFDEHDYDSVMEFEEEVINKRCDTYRGYICNNQPYDPKTANVIMDFCNRNSIIKNKR